MSLSKVYHLSCGQHLLALYLTVRPVMLNDNSLATENQKLIKDKENYPQPLLKWLKHWDYLSTGAAQLQYQMSIHDKLRTFAYCLGKDYQTNAKRFPPNGKCRH